MCLNIHCRKFETIHLLMFIQLYIEFDSLWLTIVRSDHLRVAPYRVFGQTNVFMGSSVSLKPKRDYQTKLSISIIRHLCIKWKFTCIYAHIAEHRKIIPNIPIGSLKPFLRWPPVIWSQPRATSPVPGVPCAVWARRYRVRDDWRKPFLWFIVISQWGHAPGDTRSSGGRVMICLDNTNNYQKSPARIILQSGKWECVGIPNVQCTCFRPASAHHNSANLGDLNQNICLETKSLFIVPELPCQSGEGLSLWWRHPT